ncbi:hypothetical protein FZEAL_1990 [Fusarium zealandicum]|uniref:Major facilitator superfamily (MFS) profile domain-containing protein n=1 Tax=Fusarium zealandicum TaxID=1053134 RepID=A0A8H4URX3_9HYPO|nr:hypothetical protein FZEAL_1990 [Fusarium zealandicum]
MRDSASSSALRGADHAEQQQHENGVTDERTPLLKSTHHAPDGRSEPASEVPGGEDGRGILGEQEEETTVLAEEVSVTKLALIFGTAWIGVFLGAIDSTIIATLSGPISSEFHSLSLLSWLATAYLISNAACQPISGRLTDIFGRGPGLVFSNIFFAAGNLICGLARSQTVMIIGRIVAGIGGGGLMSISTFLGSDLVPLRKRGIVQGLGNICYGSGAMLGGVFGGILNDHTSGGWRLAFLIQVPPVLLSAVAVWFLVKVPPKQSDKSFLARIDFTGAFLTVGFLVLLLLGLNSGGNLVPWTHPLPLTTIPLAVITFGLFLFWESRALQPIIPVKLLLDRTVFTACLCNLLCSMVVMGCLFYVPLYLQVLGSSATQSGVQILPSPVGISIGSLTSGYVMKKTGKYTKLGITALIILCLGVVLLTVQNEHTPRWLTAVAFLFIGTGYGSMLTTTLLACIAAVDHSQQAVITSATYLARSLGGTVGITVSSAVYQNILKARLWDRFGDEPGAAEEIHRIRDDLAEIKHLPEGCDSQACYFLPKALAYFNARVNKRPTSYAVFWVATSSFFYRPSQNLLLLWIIWSCLHLLQTVSYSSILILTIIVSASSSFNFVSSAMDKVCVIDDTSSEAHDEDEQDPQTPGIGDSNHDDNSSHQAEPTRTLELTSIEQNARRDYIRIALVVPCTSFYFDDDEMYKKIFGAFSRTIEHYPFLAGCFVVSDTDANKKLALVYPQVVTDELIATRFTMPRPSQDTKPTCDQVCDLSMDPFSKALFPLNDHGPDPEDGKTFPVALRVSVVEGMLVLGFAFSEAIFDGLFIHNFFREYLSNTYFSLQKKPQVIERVIPGPVDCGLDNKHEFPCWDWSRSAPEAPTPRKDLRCMLLTLKFSFMDELHNRIRRLVLLRRSSVFPDFEDCVLALVWIAIMRARSEAGSLDPEDTCRVNYMVPAIISTRLNQDLTDYFGNSTVAAVASCDATELLGPGDNWADVEQGFSDIRRLRKAAQLLHLAKQRINSTYLRKIQGLKQAISPAEDNVAYDRALRRHTNSLCFEDWTCYGAEYECGLNYIKCFENAHPDPYPYFFPCKDDLKEGTVILLPRQEGHCGIEDYQICVCLDEYDLKSLQFHLEEDGWWTPPGKEEDVNSSEDSVSEKRER